MTAGTGAHIWPLLTSGVDVLFSVGDAFLLVYSVESRESFEEVLRLREQIGESIRSASTNNSKNNKPKNTPIPMLIAGTSRLPTLGNHEPAVIMA